MSAPEGRQIRTRREPPHFRRIEVRRVERLTPRLVRITFGGSDLAGLTVDAPAASVRLLIPGPDSGELVIPTWNGNEFLLADGTRPVIRTFTPLRVDETAFELDLEVVVHDGGAASTWALGAHSGMPAALSGPGRGYAIDPETDAFLLAGDETAVPAIGQLLEALHATAEVQVHIEIAAPEAEHPLPEHPRLTATWHVLPFGAPPGNAMVDAVIDAAIPDRGKVWVAGEAASVQRIRRHLFEERHFRRADATVRGYWKMGRRGDD